MVNATIRPAQPDEALQINTLVAAGRIGYRNPEYGLDDAWVEQIQAELLGPEELAECRENIIRAQLHPEKHLYLVAGTHAIDAVLYAEKHETEQEVVRLFVAEHLRGLGLGSRLMEQYEDWASPELRHEVYVVPYNKGAIRFYERIGYETTPGSQQTFPDKVTTITMTREPSGGTD